jgi:hypothetical protein
MLRARTLKILASLLAGYAGLWLLATLAPDETGPLALILMAPLLSVYLLHRLGVPGLLEHHGLCGWGWCAPTIFGWVFTSAVLLACAWLLAWLVGSLAARMNAR